MRKRIVSKVGRQEHLNRFLQDNPSHKHNKSFLDLLGDLATVNSNYVHNPKTGHSEFAKDTTNFVVNIARRRNWISVVGKLNWK